MAGVNLLSNHSVEVIHEETFHYVTPAQPFELEVVGPLKLVLTTLTTMKEDQHYRDFHVPVWLNHELHAMFRYQTVRDTRHVELAVGFPRRALVLIPEGKHHLKVAATQAHYLRFANAETDAFLFSGLNKVEPDAENWELGSAAHRLALPEHPLAHLSSKLADPKLRDGAITALQDLRHLAQQHSSRHLHDWADEVALYMRYEEWLPDPQQQPLIRQYRDLGKRGPVPFIEAANFQPIDLTYSLGSRSVQLPVRIWVPLNALETLQIQFDQQSVQFLTPEPFNENFARVGFEVPAGVDKLRIRHAVPLGVEVARDAHFELQQPELAYYLEQLGTSPLTWFNQSLTKFFDAETPFQVLAQQQLAMHFQPLTEFIQDRDHSHWLPPQNSKPLMAEPQYNADQMRKMRPRAAGMDALEAVRVYSQLIRSHHQPEDYLSLVQALLELGEHDLACHYLDVMIASNRGREQAVAAYHRYFEKQSRQRDLLNFHGSLYKAFGNEAYLQRLADIAQQQGRNRLAERTADLLGKAEFVSPEKDFNPHITFYGGAHLHRNGKRSGFNAYMLQPGQQLELQDPNSQWLELEVRPVHTEPTSSLSGSLRVSVNDETLHFHYRDNRPSAQVATRSQGASPHPGRPERFAVFSPGASLRVQGGDHPLWIRFKPIAEPQKRYEDQAINLLERLSRKKILNEADLLQASRLHQEWPHSESLQQLSRPIIEHSYWQALRSTNRSAGIRVLPDLEPTANAFLRLRQYLIAPARPGEQLIRGERSEEIKLNLATAQKVSLQIAIDAISGVKANPVKLEFWNQREKLRGVTLSPEEGWQKINLDLTEGRHTLKIVVQGADSHQFLRLRLDPSLLRTPTKTWFVATADQPIQLLFAEPTVLRVERKRGNHSDLSYVHVEAGQKSLTFKPQPGSRTALYRFSKRVLRKGDWLEQTQHTVSFQEPLPLAEPSFSVPLRLDSETPTNEAKPTWSWLSLTRSRNVEDDDVAQQGLDRFTEHQLTWRGSLLPGFSRARVLYRDHEDTSRTIGFNASHTYETLARHRWQFYLSGYQQDLPDSPSALFVRMSWSRGFRLGSNWGMRPQATFFGRVLDEQVANPNNLSMIDPDVYTSYKEHHQHGLRLEDSIYWRPFADTWLEVTPRLDSNEDLFSLDRASIDLRMAQMLGAFEVSLGTSSRRYFADDNRRNDLNILRYNAEVKWRFQQRNQTRWELGLGYVADDNGRSDWLFSVGYIFGDRGDYRRFAPQEVLFRKLKIQLNDAE
jgi:hypothetical protein